MTGSNSYDAIVVGGGVIGCAVAYELARQRVGVLLLERDHLAAGASGVAAGMLAPQSEAQQPDGWLHLLLGARQAYEAFAEQLRTETGIDVEWRRDGVLRVAADEWERNELQERGAWQREMGLDAQWLEPDDIRRFESLLSPDVAGALWLPEEAQVHGERLVRALARAASLHGAHLREGDPVSEVLSDGNRVAGVRTANERFQSPVVIVAAGAFTGAVQGLPDPLPVTAVKGEIVSASDGSGSVPRHIIWGRNAYVVPKVAGSVLIGATEEADCFDNRASLGSVGRLIDAGTRLLPAMARLPLEGAWSGLRPALPDRLPAVGPLRNRHGLFVATGHYRNGMLLAPLTGRLIAALILGEKLVDHAGLLSPDRLETLAPA